jgi:two-component system, cell cycle sensor histidine kinase and response regulator CckA
MNTSNKSELPLEEEVLQLRARTAQLEELVSRMRGSSETFARHNDEAVREIELQYREVFENVSVCMFLIDVTSDGRFKFAGFNPAEEKAVGLSSAEVSGKFVEELFADGLARELNATYRRCLEAGKPITYDNELDLPGGRRNFHSNLIPIRNASGQIHRIVGACIDTTDFKRSQEEAFARQKLESLGVLASGIAHDFNNLLGGILSSAELALTERAEGSTAEDELRRIKTASIRGAEIVRELMAYGGQESGAFEAVDMVSLVNEMLDLLRISMSKTTLLQIEMSEDLPFIHANPAQIRRVVMNLITNASEAMEERPGTIRIAADTVKVGQGPSATEAINLVAGDYLRLEVSDTGSGMTPAVQARIFDPFFTTRCAGRGLGLAAVQGIIRSHGGAISVASNSGHGTRFEILLPSTDKAVRETGDITVLPSGNECGTVLIVEDEELLRLAVSKMLRKAGFSVIEAGDGSTGADLFRSNERKIDMVLLDMTLPGMSGSEVLEELRRIQPSVKVIFTSAFGRGKVLSSIGGRPPWGFLRKPYELSALTSLLREAVNEPKTSGTAAG